VSLWLIDRPAPDHQAGAVRLPEADGEARARAGGAAERG